MSAPAFEISAGGAEPAHGFFANRLIQRLLGDPLGLLGLSLVLLVLFCGIFADWITPYDPFKIAVPERMQPPSLVHVMGTDSVGHDIFSRVIKGSQIALVVGVLSIALSLAGGLAAGLAAGYGPRWLDNAILLIADTAYSFPAVMLALAVITILGSDLRTIVLVVVIFQTPVYARLVRTSTLAMKNSEFIFAERSLGAGSVRILVRHILPNIIGPLFVLGSMDIPSVITLEAGLSFLGLGIPPPAPSWGRILYEGYNLIFDAPWIVVAGGIPLIITTLGFTFLGESLRDMLDPKLRRMV
ncbi:MAG TPA: ABC transporter permease [Candidatus Angelobacter sp.]|nr:ABC transporter permease [Candidatus Angelobacter sp.]